MIGVSPDSWCLHACGYGDPGVPNRLCYGDFTCASPTPIVLAEDQVVNGANLSFVDVSPAERIPWGVLKSRYP